MRNLSIRLKKICYYQLNIIFLMLISLTAAAQDNYWVPSDKELLQRAEFAYANENDIEVVMYLYAYIQRKPENIHVGDVRKMLHFSLNQLRKEQTQCHDLSNQVGQLQQVQGELQRCQVASEQQKKSLSELQGKLKQCESPYTTASTTQTSAHTVEFSVPIPTPTPYNSLNALVQSGLAQRQAGNMIDALISFAQAAQLAPGDPNITRYLQETRYELHLYLAQKSDSLNVEPSVSSRPQTELLHRSKVLSQSLRWQRLRAAGR